MLRFKKLTALLVGAVVTFSVGTSFVKADASTMAAQAFSKEKIMRKDTTNKTLELELKGKVSLAENYAVYSMKNGRSAKKSLSDVMVGAENVTVYYNKDGQAYLIFIDGDTPIKDMRIGIMNSGFASLEHDSLSLKSADGFKIVDKVANITKDIAVNTEVTLSRDVDDIKVVQGGDEIYRTKNRVYALPINPSSDPSKIQITNFKRAYGYPSYRGEFEITVSATAGKLNVINEVEMENYLYQVVPSEMPASFGTEALKAQAVAARTYALADYFSNRYAARGFFVDDSTLSQVYNNSAENALTNQAVSETKGKIMKSNGTLVDARYYSTSGGYGAGRHEVWSDAGAATMPGTPVPYLQAKSYTYDPADNSKMLNINTADEKELNTFYKTLSYTGYDSDSLYFRWKVGLTKEQFEKTVNKNILLRYAADPKFILTKDESGNFVSKAIPAEGIGTLKNMYVAKRGAGGNIMELVIEGSTGTYKLIKEYNIRFTIRPSKADTAASSDIIAYRAKGGSLDYDPAGNLKNPSILYSAFFTFDIDKDAGGQPTAITFYGGGNGHAVGMSQYGASALGAKGWAFDKILTSYYSNMDLVDMNDGLIAPSSNSVKMLADYAIEGIDEGQYKPSSENAFKTVIEKAVELSNKADATDIELQAAVKKILGKLEHLMTN
jgi:stage II sporulation protein D